MKRLHSGSWTGTALAVAVMTFVCTGAASGGQFTGIVSFGDSLTDVGNFYAATGGASPPALFGYDAGRATNGLNWVEYLAHDLGIAAPTASANGGTDYAYVGATTGSGTTNETFIGATAIVPNIGTQVDNYLGSHTPTAGQLFTIWGGANDFLNAGVTDPSAPVANIVAEITQLAAAGAKQFLIPNLPPLGALPSTSSMSPPIPDQLNALAAGFNAYLQAETAQLAASLGVHIYIADVYSLMSDAIAHPSKYGFTNVTDAAILSGSDGSGYLFWDTVHTTTQADQFIGELGALSVPEPSSLVLLGTAATLLLGGLAGHSRRKAAGWSRA